MEKYKFNKSIGGKIVKKDDRYIVTDYNILDTLVLSSTNLNPNKSEIIQKGQGAIILL